MARRILAIALLGLVNSAAYAVEPTLAGDSCVSGLAESFPGLRLDRKSLEQSEELRDALLDAALQHAQAGRSDAALCGLTLVIATDPSSDVAWNGRGYILWQKRRYAEALRDFDEAVRLDPDDGTYYANRAMVLFETRQYQRALADYEAALKLDPKLAIALKATEPYASRQDKMMRPFKTTLPPWT
jgi:tetratricopeptide (TPR) repeat protein